MAKPDLIEELSSVDVVVSEEHVHAQLTPPETVDPFSFNPLSLG
jgi:hypothetical protein